MRPWFLSKHAMELYKVMPVLGGVMLIGHYFDRRTDYKMSDFHNKSKLFGGKELAPGERVW